MYRHHGVTIASMLNRALAHDALHTTSRKYGMERHEA